MDVSKYRKQCELKEIAVTLAYKRQRAKERIATIQVVVLVMLLVMILMLIFFATPRS